MLCVFFLIAANGVQMLELVNILETYLLGVVYLTLLGLTLIKFLFIVDMALTDNYGTSRLIY